MRFLIAPALLHVVSAFAVPPENPANFVYYEHTSFAPAGSGGYFNSRAMLFNTDGTYTTLYDSTRYFFPSNGSRPYSTTDSPDGRYSYKKLSDQSAELQLAFPFLFGPATGVRQLPFASADAGQVPSTIAFAPRFRFAPITARAALSNSSNRSFVKAGGSAFLGFVVTGDVTRAVLIRATGPALAQFGISDFLPNPRITVTSTLMNVHGVNDDWSSEAPVSITRTGAALGAFPLPEKSKDAAVIMGLPPGNYVAQVDSAVTADSGQVLIEIYMLP